MNKGPGVPRPPAARPLVQPKLAPHVQAALARTAPPQSARSPGTEASSAQPKMPADASAAGPRSLASHVQAALAAHGHHPVQMKAAPAQPPRSAPPLPPRPAPRQAPALLRPPSPRAPVAQRTQYKSVVAQEDFIVRPSSNSAGTHHRLSVTRPGASGNELAYMTYTFYPDKSVTMGHVEAYGMPNGTKVGYLLFYIMAKHAKDKKMTTVTIGTGVDEFSARRNLADAQERNDQDAITSANQSLAAVHIYSALGFDARDAVRLSNSTVSVDNVIARSRAKIGTTWLQKVEDSGCFLTTACVQARGLPDDCRELAVLRRFRDDLVATGEAGRTLVESYYQVAPEILEALGRRADRTAILEGLFGEIQTAVAAVEAGQPEVALEIYAREVARLVREFLPAPASPEPRPLAE